jgi:hypothetical protein
MPKRISNKSRPKDINQAAFEMVKRSTSETELEPMTLIAKTLEKPTRDDISRVMAEMGRRGGKIGGKRRLETMTDAQRRKAAKKAANARWTKNRKLKSGN